MIFKLIKSIANLPNISYFLSFDKNIVATALNKHHEGNGEKYLEKIIQVPFSLPNIRDYKLEEIVKSAIQDIIDKNPEINRNWEEKYKNAWEYTIYYKFFNLLKNTRSIKRYINLVKINYNNSLKNEIDIIDFLLITILQLEHTELYNFVKDNKTFFTYLCQNTCTGGIEAEREREQEIEKYKNELNKILEQYNLNQRKSLIVILCFLFPSIKRIYNNIIILRPESESSFNINGRICSFDNFDKFFWLNCDENDISLSEMKECIELTNNTELFSQKLLEFNERKKLKIFLKKFEEYIENDIPLTNIKNIIKAFFNKGDYFDNTYDGFLSLNIHAYIYMIITDLLNLKINNQVQILEECITNNESLFPMVRLVSFLVNSLKDGSQYKQNYINETNIIPLINGVLSKIYSLSENDIKNIDDKTKAFNGHIINNPMLSGILFFWYQNGNIERLKNYVQAVTNTSEKLLIFLDNISSISHLSSWVEKNLRKDELEIYFDINELENRLIAIDDKNLSTKDKEIKERALRGIKNVNKF